MSYTVIELSIISALASLFLNFCMKEGHILAWWLDFWAWVLLDKKIKYPKGVDRRDYKFAQVDSPLFKPLGYCVVCMNVWVSLGIGIFTWDVKDIFIIIIISSFIVRLTHGKLL